MYHISPHFLLESESTDKALLLQLFLSNNDSSHAVDRSDLRDIQRWLFWKDNENFALLGNDWDTWGTAGGESKYATDFITLRRLQNDEQLAHRVNTGIGYSWWLMKKLVTSLVGLLMCRSGRGTSSSSVQLFSSIIEKVDLIEIATSKNCSSNNDTSNTNHGREQQDSPYDIAKAMARNNTRLLNMTIGVTTVLASCLPVASITILYFIKSMKIRLVVVAVCNFMFSLLLKWATSARLFEVFMGTAAYVALLVYLPFRPPSLSLNLDSNYLTSGRFTSIPVSPPSKSSS